MNVRPPKDLPSDFLEQEAILLREESIAKGIVSIESLPAVKEMTGKASIPKGAPADRITLNPAGESIISYADFAVAMIDEIEKGNHIGERISVVNA